MAIRRIFTLSILLTTFSWFVSAQDLDPGVPGSIKFLGQEGDSLLTGNNPFGGANVINGELYFAMWRDGIGAELFKLTAEEEIVLVADLLPGEDSGDPGGFLLHQDKLYFAANTPANGRELHVWDGTSVSMVTDLHAEDLSSNPANLSPFGDNILFTAEDATSTQEDVSKRHLWITDGTESGTRRLSAPSFYGVEVAAVGAEQNGPSIPNNGEWAFFAGTDTLHGREIWVTNGEPEPFGTRLLLDVRVGNTGSNITNIVPINDTQMHFRAETDADWDGRTEQFDFYNNESWVTDGTIKGTYFLGDYADRAETGDPRATIKSQASTYKVFNGWLHYRVDNGENHVEPSRMNGKINGQEIISNINGLNNNGVDQPSWWQSIEVLDGKIFGKANSTVDNHSYPRVGNELFAYYPDLDSNVLIADIFEGPTTSSTPRNLAAINGKIYMAANTISNNEGIDVWVIDPAGDGNDPADVAALSRNASLVDDYLVYRIYDDVDDTNQGNLGLGQLPQGPFMDFNGKVFFGNYYDRPMLYDDGSENKDAGPYVDPMEEIMVPATGETNAFVNAPPVITLTSPTNNSELEEGIPETLTVDVSDPEEDAITKVEYYYGETFEERTLIGTATDGDYSFLWEVPVPSEGLPTKIFAIAYQDEDPTLGHLAPDSTLSMFSTVVIDGNTPPTVELASIVEGEEFFEGFPIALTVSASSDTETVYYVVGNDTIATITDASTSYEFIWQNVALGSYTVKAIAVDNLDASTTSVEISISVVEEPLGLDDVLKNVYPNPTNGKLILNGKSEFVSYGIVDLSGAFLVRDRKITANQIDVSELKEGAYILRLSLQDGKSSFVRFIKK